MTDEQIFDQVVRIPVGERAAFLTANCIDQPNQRARVESLIAAHEQSDSMLDTEAMAMSDTQVEELKRKTVGDFEIIRELGRGGMGIVYEARQKSLKRKVALKVLSSGLGLSSKAILRFCREAEAAGKLHHTNIVPIYTTGEDHGVHFYAMELIDGPSLDAVIRGLRSESSDGKSDGPDELPAWVKETALFAGPQARSPGQNSGRTLVTSNTQTTQSSIASGSGYFDHVATMIADVAEALDHAHEHGVIHRDIKPSNLLLAPDGRLSINDFGLARMLEQPGMTMSGEFVGSPLYMSPEQITAGRVSLDHRTDIYSLGATLYELLALEPPFPGQTRDQVLSQILHKEAISTRKMNRRIPVDLDTICMKAIDKDPDRRYQTAAQLADDLRKYVNRHAISARRLGPIGKAFKFVRRRPAIASLLLVVLISSTIVSFLVRENLLRQALNEEVTLLQEKDRVVDSVFAGDLRRAEEQWEYAKNLGAEDGWLSLSRALIELHAGNHVLAQVELDAAERLNGPSLAIDSLRIILQFETGSEASYFRAASQLKSRKRETIEDHFYFGVAQKWADPWMALDSLDEAYGQRTSMHAIRLHRAFAAWQCAIDSPKALEALNLIRRAIKDGVFWVEQHPDDQYARAILVQTYLTAANIYQDLGRREDQLRSLRNAEDELSEIDEKPAAMEPILARYLFLQHLGKQAEADDFLRGSLETAEDAINYVAAYCSIAEFRRADADAAGAALDRMERSESRLKESSRYIAKLEAKPDQDQRHGWLIGFREYLVGKGDTGDYTQFEQDWLVLRLLGDLDTAREHAREAGAYFRGFTNDQQKDLGPICDFLAGINDDPTQLVNQCEHSRRTLATAHFAIAIDALANGDREKAMDSFRDCVSQDVFQFYVHQWSLALIDKLERAPSWPSWIPEVSEQRYRSDE